MKENKWYKNKKAWIFGILFVLWAGYIVLQIYNIDSKEDLDNKAIKVFLYSIMDSPDSELDVTFFDKIIYLPAVVYPKIMSIESGGGDLSLLEPDDLPFSPFITVLIFFIIGFITGLLIDKYTTKFFRR